MSNFISYFGDYSLKLIISFLYLILFIFFFVGIAGIFVQKKKELYKILWFLSLLSNRSEIYYFFFCNSEVELITREQSDSLKCNNQYTDLFYIVLNSKLLVGKKPKKNKKFLYKLFFLQNF